LLITMVARFCFSKAVHVGSFGVFGAPLRAKAIQA
jgi:hypothetical protein